MSQLSKNLLMHVLVRDSFLTLYTGSSLGWKFMSLIEIVRGLVHLRLAMVGVLGGLCGEHTQSAELLLRCRIAELWLI